MKRDSHTILKHLGLVVCLVLFGATASMAQKTVTGTITDADNGEPLIGANVLIKGTSAGTVTDIDGNFSIEVSETDVLVISYTGYSPMEVPVGTQSTFDLTLSSGEILDEVVVIGYGTAKKRDLTGAVALIDNEDFNQGVIVSADQLIQGKTAGVQVLNNSGQPGGATTVRIRGNTSIRLGNGPLYVLDGVPLSGISGRPDLNVAGLGGSPSSNPLNFLNPEDIASMSVLKDASAAAIYGSRGANGVIEITTKKGRNLDPTINFSSQVGFSSILNQYEVLDASEYRQALSDYDRNGGDFGDDVDAFDEITRTALVQNHALSINGGSDRGSYRFGVGYFDQEGIIEKNNLKRLNATFNGSYDFLPNDRLKVDAWVVASNTRETLPPIATDSGFRGSLIGNALQWNPTHRLREDDGSLVIDPEFGDFMNPLALNEAYNDNASTFDVIGAFAPSVKILDNLTYRFLYSVNHSRGERRASVKPWLNLEDVEDRGVAYLFNRTVTSQVLQHTLNYDVNIGNTSDLNVLVGYEYQKIDDKAHDMTAFDFIDTDLDFTNFFQDGSAGSRQVNSNAPPPAELQSFFGRAQLNLLDNRFLVTGTFRADGSSKFGENNRYGFFPAFAGAWNIHNESFASGGLFDNLKLRAGWGITGNQDFPSGAALDRYALLGNGAVEQTNVGNPDLQWETTTTFNVGLDFALLDYKLYGSVEYFNRRTTDLLFQLAPSQPAPATLYWVNLDGDVLNAGVEFALNSLVIDRPDFSWDIGVNVTFLQNELQNYNGPNFPYGTLFGQGISDAMIHRLESDQPLNAFYVRDWQGLDAEGFDTFRDADGNIVSNTQDFFYLGDPNPDVLLGLFTTLNFNRFSLNMAWNGAFGQQIYNNTKNTVTPIGNLGSRNIDATLVGNEVQEDITNSVKSSSRYMENGDYFKLANATLSYQIGDIGSSVTQARVFLTGTNLLLFTGYEGFDPEVNTVNDANGLPSAGIDYIPYPSARTVMVGVNFYIQ